MKKVARQHGARFRNRHTASFYQQSQTMKAAKKRNMQRLKYNVSVGDQHDDKIDGEKQIKDNFLIIA